MLHRAAFLASPLVALLLACTRAPSPPGPVAVDAAAPPSSRVVALDGARLEVLDWGGKGDALVFVAGLGASAHAFEGFASRFTDHFHVFGVTRRGHGASEATAAGGEPPPDAGRRPPRAPRRCPRRPRHVRRPLLRRRGDDVPRRTSTPIGSRGIVYLDAALRPGQGACRARRRHPPAAPRSQRRRHGLAGRLPGPSWPECTAWTSRSPRSRRPMSSTTPASTLARSAASLVPCATMSCTATTLPSTRRPWPSTPSPTAPATWPPFCAPTRTRRRRRSPSSPRSPPTAKGRRPASSPACRAPASSTCTGPSTGSGPPTPSEVEGRCGPSSKR